MRHALLWVGRENRGGGEATLASRYFSRLKGFANWDEKVIKPAPVSLGKNEQKRRECKIIEAWLMPGDWLLLCDQTGKQLSSTDFAAKLTHWSGGGHKRLVFMIGGAMGVTPALRQRANFVLSLSQMTLPHALARVLLLEQIYRGFCIQSGHPYHHDG